MKQKQVAIRATLQAVTINTGATLLSTARGFVGVSPSPDPMSATLEFAGAHGPIRVEVPATAVSGLTPRASRTG